MSHRLPGQPASRANSLIALSVAITLFVNFSISRAQQSDATPVPSTIGEIVRLDPALDGLIPPDAEIEVLAGGYEWVEGPVWVPRDGGYLLYSDVFTNRVYRWDDADGAKIFMEPSGYTGVADYRQQPGSNGLALSPDGEVAFCEHGDRRVSILPWTGGKRTLADSYQGRRLNSPNDLVFNSRGDLYFTDPPYGLPEREADPRRELDFYGVYLLPKGGELQLLTTEFTKPNGIALSPDERTLYVAQSDPEAPLWKAFPVGDDGTIGEGRVLYDARELLAELPGNPDGLAVDASGHIFATGPGGVCILSPEGKLIGRILTGELTGNCCFGGEDGSTLFITADMYLCRVQTTTKGMARHD